MKFISVTTRAFLPPRDNIYDLLDKYLPRLVDGDIIVITSKVLAIHQGRCVKIKPAVKKDELIKKEADAYISRRRVPLRAVILTLKQHTLIPSAGIDESNGNGYYILWPRKVNSLLKEIHRYLRRKHHLKRLALIATDSHTIPLRYGVIGISIGFYGLEPLFDYRGKEDIFGKKLIMTRSNIVDALAAMSVLLMGEAKERRPIFIIRGAKFITFTKKDTWRDLIIPQQIDLYAPLLKAFRQHGKVSSRRFT